MRLTEFFEHALDEKKKKDGTFKGAKKIEKIAEAPPIGGDADGVENMGGMGADPTAPTFKGPSMAGAAPMTQDTAPTSEGSFNFFTDAATRMASKHEGVDSRAVEQFARALDNMAYGIYSSVQEPDQRGDFESEVMKQAADFNKMLGKLFKDIQELQSYANPY